MNRINRNISIFLASAFALVFSMIVSVCISDLHAQQPATNNQQPAASPAPERVVLAVSKEEAQALEIHALKAEVAKGKLDSMAQRYQDQFARESAPLQHDLQVEQGSLNTSAEEVKKAHNWGADVQFDSVKREFFKSKVTPVPNPSTQEKEK